MEYADSIPYTYTTRPLEIIWYVDPLPAPVMYPDERSWRDAPSGVVWHTLADVAAGPGRTVVLTDPAGASQRFYRLITPREP